MGRVALASLLALHVACDEPEPSQSPEERRGPEDESPDEPGPTQPGPDRLGPSLELLRRGESAYAPPSETDAEQYRDWVGHLSTSLLQGRLPTQAAPAGFEGRVLHSGLVWLLAEREAQHRGAGAVALRVDARAPIVVEVPHSFFDRGTLELGLTIFDEVEARALVVNTVHRGGNGTKQERMERVRSGKSESDVAHQPASYFHQAHLQLGRIWPEDHVVQLHGYRDEKVPNAKIIVSAAGTSAATAPLAKAFNDEFGAGTARLYPEEVKDLGGTQNAQARVNRNESRVFFHVEIASSLRTQLRRQKSLRQRFARALSKGLSVH